MFDLFGNDRLNEWRNFRNTLESSETALEDNLIFWRKAPFVSPYLDPLDPKGWPDPWHLVLDDRLDHLAICLGLLYTLKLTQRFMDQSFEIHMAMSEIKKPTDFYLVIDNKSVLNYERDRVLTVDDISNIKTSIIWQTKVLP